MKVNEIKAGAILSYMGLFLNMIIGILCTPIIIRALGQSEYGLYSLIGAIISYLTVLDFGLGNAIIIYTSRYRAKNEKENEYKLNGMLIFIYIIIGIIAAAVCGILYFNSNRLFGATFTDVELSKVKTMIIILGVYFLLNFPLSIFGYIITAYEKFIFSKVIQILKHILPPILIITILFFNYKSVEMIILTVIINIILLLINMLYCFKNLKIKIVFGKFNIGLLKEIFLYSFFIFLAIIVDKVNWSLGQIILGGVVGTAAVSIYSVAAQLQLIYQSFSTAISGVLLPKISIMVEKKATDKELSDIFVKVGRLQYIILGYILIAFIIFGKKFIEIWAGYNYLTSYYIALILMIPVTFPLLQNTGISILQAKNKHKFRTLVYSAIAIANIAISVPLAKIYEGIGAAIGTAVSLVIGNIIIMNIYYYRKINIDVLKFWKEIFKMSIPNVINLIIFIYLNTRFEIDNIYILIIEAVIYSLLYITITFKFIANDYEKDIILKPINKVFKKRGVYDIDGR